MLTWCRTQSPSFAAIDSVSQLRPCSDQWLIIMSRIKSQLVSGSVSCNMLIDSRSSHPTGFDAGSLTAWGFGDVASDPQNGSFGGMLPKVRDDGYNGDVTQPLFLSSSSSSSCGLCRIHLPSILWSVAISSYS